MRGKDRSVTGATIVEALTLQSDRGELASFRCSWTLCNESITPVQSDTCKSTHTCNEPPSAPLTTHLNTEVELKQLKGLEVSHCSGTLGQLVEAKHLA